MESTHLNTMTLTLSGLENLPTELQRNFKLMRDLDTRAQNLMQQIDEKANDFMETLIKDRESIPEEVRKDKLKSIQDSFNLAKEYGDDKVQLAIQTYELVDKHIRRLDSDLARFEGEIQDKTLSARSKSEEIIGKSKYFFLLFKVSFDLHFNLFILEGRKKGKDVKTVTKKKRAASSEDDEQRGNAGNTSQKASKKQKVNQEKEGRKGQKVNHLSSTSFVHVVRLCLFYYFLLFLSLVAVLRFFCSIFLRQP